MSTLAASKLRSLKDKHNDLEAKMQVKKAKEIVETKTVETLKITKEIK